MRDFNSVFITCCKLLTVLMCIIIHASRLSSDSVSDRVEINNSLLKLKKKTPKNNTIVGLPLIKHSQ